MANLRERELPLFLQLSANVRDHPWGVADSGLTRLWEQGVTGRPGPGPRPGPRVAATLGYGLAAPGARGTLTPYAGLALTGARTQTWRTGLRLTAGQDLAAHLETSWRPTPGGGTPGVTPEARLRF